MVLGLSCGCFALIVTWFLRLWFDFLILLVGICSYWFGGLVLVGFWVVLVVCFVLLTLGCLDVLVWGCVRVVLLVLVVCLV